MRLQMAAEVWDSLEIAHTEYLNFLKCYFCAFSVILNQLITMQFVETPEHKLRNIVVEILNRLPHSEVLCPFVLKLHGKNIQVRYAKDQRPTRGFRADRGYGGSSGCQSDF